MLMQLFMFDILCDDWPLIANISTENGIVNGAIADWGANLI